MGGEGGEGGEGGLSWGGASWGVRRCAIGDGGAVRFSFSVSAYDE